MPDMGTAPDTLATDGKVLAQVGGWVKCDTGHRSAEDELDKRSSRMTMPPSSHKRPSTQNEWATLNRALRVALERQWAMSNKLAGAITARFCDEEARQLLSDMHQTLTTLTTLSELLGTIVADGQAEASTNGQLHGLTPRQLQVMNLVLAGHPSKNIAADLHISQRTVENHRASIMKKTGATSLPALARLAFVATGSRSGDPIQGRWQQ